MDGWPAGTPIRDYAHRLVARRKKANNRREITKTHMGK